MSIAETAREWKTHPDATEELEKRAKDTVDACIKIGEKLERLAKALDLERSFFDEYLPREMAKRVKLENTLDSQYDKLRSRLLTEQESYALREKLKAERPPINSWPEDGALKLDERSAPNKAPLHDPARDGDNQEVDLYADDTELEQKNGAAAQQARAVRDATENDPFEAFLKGEGDEADDLDADDKESK